MPAAGGRNLLLIAFHYPPCSSSSGLQRTLSFSIHLRAHGWNPIILTATPGAYDRISTNQLTDIPSDVPVVRTFAADTARHLSFRGRYWSRLAIPDRWRTWWLTAVPQGVRLIRRHRVEAIWSTYPISTAHNIGASLARMTRLPWIADFRDPMVEYIPATKELFPRDPRLRHARLSIEARAVRHARRLVFCTEGARRIAAERYPNADSKQLCVISNGYEEKAFRDAESATAPSRRPGRRLLLHSGTVYPGTDRDPTALMQAIKTLSERGAITAESFELRLRDPSSTEHFRRLAAEIGVTDFVSILPPIPYRDALAEMLSADGLLLLQGYTSNPAVPAKLYEYLRSSRPILALVHPDGETAAALRDLGFDTLAPLTDRDAITDLIARWLAEPSVLQHRLPATDAVAKFSRTRLTERLAILLDEVIREAQHR